MRIDSMQFLIFLPTVMILYRIFPHKARWFLLLCAGYVFCGYAAPALLYVIITVTLVSYIFARKTYSAYEPVMKKVYTVIPIVVALGFLFVYKYFNAICKDIAGALFFIKIEPLYLDLIVPLGLSFFTIRAIMYAIEVYRGNMLPEKHIGYFALYISFFPTLLAGPLQKPNELITQLRTKKPFAAYEAAHGLKLIAVGFFKIIAVARQIYICVDSVFAAAGSSNAIINNGFTVMLASFMFAVQIYCEFSGYCDIAVGCCEIFGIKLKKNYKMPYFATGIRDFQSRWNITLGNFFREYIYAPLGGKSESKARYLLNMGIVFALVGMWYGAGITFIVFGIMHFAMRMLAELTQNKRAALKSKLNIRQKNKLLPFFKGIITFAFVCFSLMLFRAESLRDFGAMIYTLFTGWGDINAAASLKAVGFSPIALATSLIAIFAVAKLDKQISCENNTALDLGLEISRAQTYITLCWTVVIAMLTVLTYGMAEPFAYFIF